VVEIQILEKTDDFMRFIVRGVNIPFVNALRRIMLTEVPAMAIDEIIILENSSILNDEILAHRMGLIPLKTDLDSYNLPEECKCGSELGCNLCRANLTLEAEVTDKTRTVYSGELKPENPDIAPVSDKIPLVKLAPEQRLKLEAYARLGKGKKHAKWQPVSMCTYMYLPEVKIDSERCDACGKCVKVCPEEIFVEKDGKIKTQNEIECTLCMDCVDACPKDPSAVEVSWDEKAFIFKIESTGALPVERIVTEAVEILDKNIKDFTKQVKKGMKK
jgi:DNA-directed RNA polymerase subunit D